jgi:hypothetical protein
MWFSTRTDPPLSLEPLLQRIHATSCLMVGFLFMHCCTLLRITFASLILMGRGTKDTAVSGMKAKSMSYRYIYSSGYEMKDGTLVRVISGAESCVLVCSLPPMRCRRRRSAAPRCP